MNDIAYEAFLSGDRIVDASFAYMFILLGACLVAMAVFKVVAWWSDRRKNHSAVAERQRQET